jgi:hypothetical protein
MSCFLARHDEELRCYFANGFEAEYGLRSWMGPAVDNMAATVRSDLQRPAEWDGFSEPPPQVMVCKGSRNGAPELSTEMSETALNAVRRQNRIRDALGMLGPVEARVLRAFYVPRPLTSPFGLESLGDIRAVVAFLIGVERAQGYVRTLAERSGPDATAEDREALKSRRAAAKTNVTAALTQSRILLEKARGSYSTAIGIVVRRERDEKARKFAGGAAR